MKIENLDQLIDKATIGIITIDRSSKIVQANDEIEKMFGYEDGVLLGKQLELILPDWVKAVHQSHVDRYAQNPKPRQMGGVVRSHGGKQINISGKNSKGKEFPVAIAIDVVKVSGESQYVGWVVDISELVEARKTADAARARAEELVMQLNTKVETLEGRIEQRKNATVNRISLVMVGTILLLAVFGFVLAIVKDNLDLFERISIMVISGFMGFLGGYYIKDSVEKAQQKEDKS